MKNQEFDSRVYEFVKSRVAVLCDKPVESIRDDANFFELGFDSISIVKLAMLIHEEFGRQIGLHEFYRACSVESMTKLICEDFGKGD